MWRTSGTKTRPPATTAKCVISAKAPAGYYELLTQAAAAARALQESGFIREKFGRPIPILVHDLEYPWYVFEATRTANPNGEADPFFAAMKALGAMD